MHTSKINLNVLNELRPNLSLVCDTGPMRFKMVPFIPLVLHN